MSNMDQRPAETPPPPSPSTSPRNPNPKSPSPAPTSSTLQTLFFDAVEAASPPLRQLASHSMLGGLPTTALADLHSSRSPAPKVSGATLDDQRHPGKSGAAINKNTHEIGTAPPAGGSSASSPDPVLKNGPGFQSTESESNSSQNCPSDEPLLVNKEADGAEVVPENGQEAKKDTEDEKQGPLGLPRGEDDEEKNYPGQLALTLIIIGLCLSVFLISLDRTIITTVGTNPQLEFDI